MKKYLLFGVVCLALILGSVWYSDFKKKQDKEIMEFVEKMDAERDIEQSAEIMKSQLPIKVDDKTTITDMRYNAENKAFVTDYTINGIENLTKAEITSIAEVLKAQKLKVARKSENKANFLISETSIEFDLKDANGKIYEKILITPQEMQ